MDSPPRHRPQPDQPGALVRAARHASPRLGAHGARPAWPAPLRADHRHARPARGAPASRDGGFSTAELLGNAALGIAALVAIWVVLEALGVSVVAWISAQIGVS